VVSGAAGSLASALAGVLLAAPASAATPPDIEAREAAAKAACTSGRLQEGIVILAELHARTDDSGYLFNQARCYQHNGKYHEALEHFRRYLLLPDVTPDARTRAEHNITELERTVGPHPASLPEARPPAPPPALQEHAATPAAMTARDLDPAATGRRPLRVAAWAAAGTGVAALGGAAYFGLRVRATTRTRDEALKQAGSLSADHIKQLNERGNRAEKWHWASLGLGAAALGGGAVLYYLDRRHPPTDRMPALVSPLLVPRGAGALVGATF
jgi:tetratricopeptide (TPR) repeat protein